MEHNGKLSRRKPLRRLPLPFIPEAPQGFSAEQDSPRSALRRANATRRHFDTYVKRKQTGAVHIFQTFTTPSLKSFQ